MTRPKTVELRPGEQSHLRLRAVPRTEFTLRAPPPTTLSLVQSDVVLEGSCKNLPDGTKCKVTLIVKEASDEPIEVEDVLDDLVALRVTGTTCKLTLTLDALDLKLFGKGAVGFHVEPQFPYCPAARIDPWRVQYHNLVRVEVYEGLHEKSIGDELSFDQRNIGAFRHLRTRVVIYEDDDGEGEAAADRGYIHLLELASRDESTKWRIGMGPYDGAPTDYFVDDKEKGGYEFAARFQVQRAADAPWIEVPGEVIGHGDAAPARQETIERVVVDLKFREFSRYMPDYWDRKRLHQGSVDEELRRLIPKAGDDVPWAAPLDLKKGAEPLRTGKLDPAAKRAVEKWVYVFRKRQTDDKLTLVAELFADEGGKLRPVEEWKYPVDSAGLSKHENRLQRPAGANGADTWRLEYSPADEAIYFALSRRQLPYLRLQEYLADARRVVSRCVRYTHRGDKEFVDRYLTVEPGSNVYLSRETLHLFEPMRIIEDLQVKHLKVLKNLDDWLEGYKRPDGGKDAGRVVELRYMADLARTIVNSHGRDKSKDWIDLAKLDDYIKRYDDTVAVLEQVASFYAWLKDAFEYDTARALDDPFYVGDAYLETQDDFAKFEEKRPQLPADEEALYRALALEWIEHKDFVAQRSTSTKVGKSKLQVRLDEPGNWGAKFVFGADEWKSAKTFYERGPQEFPAFIAKAFEAKLLSDKGGDQARWTLTHVDRVFSNRFGPVYQGIDGDSVAFVSRGRAGIVKVKPKFGASFIPHLELPVPDEVEARKLVGFINDELKTTSPATLKLEKLARPAHYHELFAAIEETLKPFTIVIEVVNISLTTRTVIELVSTDKWSKMTNLERAGALADIADDIGDFANAVKILTSVAWPSGATTAVGRAALGSINFVGALGSVFTYAGEFISTMKASQEGNYGKAFGHVVAGTGAALMGGAALASAGAGTLSFIGPAAMTGVGLVLLLAGAAIVYFFTDKPPNAIQAWLGSTPWGKKDQKKLTEVYRAAIELIGMPIVRPYVIRSRHGKVWLSIRLYPTFYTAGETQYRVQSLRTLAEDGYTGWIHQPVHVVGSREEAADWRVFTFPPKAVDAIHDFADTRPSKQDMTFEEFEVTDRVALGHIERSVDRKIRYELVLGVKYFDAWGWTKEPYVIVTRLGNTNWSDGLSYYNHA